MISLDRRVGEPVQSLLYRHTLGEVNQSQLTTQGGAGSEADSGASAEFSCPQQASSESDNHGVTSQKTCFTLIKSLVKVSDSNIKR